MGERAHTSTSDAVACAVLRPFRGRTFLILAMTGVLLLAPALLVGLLAAMNVVLPKIAMLVLLVVSMVPGLVMSFSLLRATSLVRRQASAVERGAIEEVLAIRRTMEGSPESQTRFGRANSALGDAELLLRFERWAEARDAFASLDVEALPEAARPGISSQHAYAMAHAGEPDRAIPLLEGAVRDGDGRKDYPENKRWYLHARLGIALSLAGRHDDAIDVLGPLPDEEECGDAREWTAVMFFLAQSLRGAGATDDAMDVYENAKLGEGPFVARAKAALDLARAAPLRQAGGPLIAREPEEEADEAVAEQLKRVMKRPS